MVEVVEAPTWLELWKLFRDFEKCCDAMLVADCDPSERLTMVLMYSEARTLLNQITVLLRHRAPRVVVV